MLQLQVFKNALGQRAAILVTGLKLDPRGGVTRRAWAQFTRRVVRTAGPETLDEALQG